MSSENDSSGVLGKKVFFLYPSAVVQNEIVQELIQQEFEVYVAKDHGALQRVLKQFPDSLVLADIDEGISEKDWELWIRGVMGNQSTKEVKIGVLSSSKDEELQKKYLNDLKVACGYTVLKKDISIPIRQILEILKTADAKGRRKYLRATMEDGAPTVVNMPYNNSFIKGTIKDISTVGFSASFEGDPELPKNSLFQDIQIKLQSVLLKVEGIVFGSRMDEIHKTYVILFTQRIDPSVRSRIRKYIQQTFQIKMDAMLKQSNLRQPGSESPSSP
ncbi:MAG: PilZ domain-containing protein [Treponema sp.]|nr:PilZ domain-containing protein [Treponema sp.]